MSKQICFVCGESYETEEIPPIKIEIGKRGVWEKTMMRKIAIGRKELPLCYKCLKAALLSATLTSSLVQSSPVRLDVEEWDEEATQDG